jgi:RNase P subunit RPR2
MQMVKHESATCPSCRSPLWFGTKSEGSGWAVYYECTSCGFEQRVGRIAMSEAETRDTVWERAEKMGQQF